MSGESGGSFHKFVGGPKNPRSKQKPEEEWESNKVEILEVYCRNSSISDVKAHMLKYHDFDAS